MASYVFNSSSSGERYNAKCLNVSDDSEWTPSAAEYPQDGTIDLSGGTSGRYLDTQWVAPHDEPWSLTFVYNVVSGVSHDIAILDYNGDDTADVWYGDQDTVPVLTPENTGLDYTPPLGNYLITEVPDLPVPVVDAIPIAHWKFDGDILDDTGNYTVSETNGEAYEDATFGQAFNTNTNLFKHNVTASANFPQSIAMWLDVNTNQDLDVIVSTDSQALIGINNYSFFAQSASNTSFTQQANSIFTLQQVYHVVATFVSDSEVPLLYIDNVLQTPQLGTGNRNQDLNVGRVGGGWQAGAVRGAINTAIDDLQFFDKVLSVGEIDALFNATPY